jgi:hypothetical protein
MTTSRDHTAVHVPWGWVGMAVVAAAILVLELAHPYYFCQDDALVAELPGTLFALRAIWSGIVPEYNPHNFLGEPCLSMGGGLFYPPLYAAYALARHALGDEAATFDILAIGQLVVGYWLSFAVARRLGVEPAVAALFAATFVLASPVVVMARCWHAFGAIAVFVPWLALLVERLRRPPVRWTWAAEAGVALGLFYHAGFPQIFLAGSGFFVAEILLFAAWGAIAPRSLVDAAVALTLGAALALPVVVQQGEIARGMPPLEPAGEGIARGLFSMLLPVPLARSPLPNDWGNFTDGREGEFYYFGTLLLLLGLIGAGRLLASAARGQATRVSERVHAILAGLAFLLALGDVGGLWKLVVFLPAGFGNNPFRIAPWFIFHATLLGALSWSHVVAWCAPAVQPTLRWATLAAGIALLAWHVTRLDIAFYRYGFVPYPELPTSLEDALAGEAGPQHRVLSIAAMRTTDPTYPLALPHALSCLYEIPTFYGYNPVMWNHRRYKAVLDRALDHPTTGLEEYGVGAILVHRTLSADWRPTSSNPGERIALNYELLLKADQSHPQRLGPDVDAIVHLFKLPGAKPLAFSPGAAPPESVGFPVTLRADGIDVDLGSRTAADPVTVNVLAWPRLLATADGRPVAVAEDAWGRLVAAVPAGAKKLAIRYRPDWQRGLTLALVPAVLGAIGLVFLTRRTPLTNAQRAEL